MLFETARFERQLLCGFLYKASSIKFRFVYFLFCYCQQVIFKMSRWRLLHCIYYLWKNERGNINYSVAKLRFSSRTGQNSSEFRRRFDKENLKIFKWWWIYGEFCRVQWSVHTLKIFQRVKRGDFEMGKFTYLLVILLINALLWCIFEMTGNPIFSSPNGAVNLDKCICHFSFARK